MTSGEESFKLEKEPGWWLWHGHLPTSDLQYSESDNNFVDGEPDWKWVASSPVYDGLVDKEPLSLSSKPDSDVFGVPKRSRKQRGWYQVRARRPRGSPILMARQLSRSRLAAELPAELVHMVVEALSSRSGSRKYLSICSTVCRHWAEALRPILFAEITLRSRTHIFELLAFLAAPLSRIAEYIEQITLAHTLPSAPLLHLLPRLSERLDVRYGATIIGPLPRTCSMSMRTIHWQLPRPIRHPNVLAFTEVTIEDVHIPAFADLVRLVWELPLLEAFRGTRLTWGAEDNLLRPHRIPAGRDFGELPGPDIALRNCASSQLWLAASLTGGLLALPDEYERIGALLRIVSSQLSDAQQIEVTARCESLPFALFPDI